MFQVALWIQGSPVRTQVWDCMLEGGHLGIMLTRHTRTHLHRVTCHHSRMAGILCDEGAVGRLRHCHVAHCLGTGVEVQVENRAQITYVSKFAKIGFANWCANARITDDCELVCECANYR